MGEESSQQPPAVPLLDFSREYAEVGEEVLSAIERVLQSQHFILGEQVTSFEQMAAEFCHVPHAIGCASGTDALWLAMAGLGIGPGDRVLTTPFSFFATVSSILRLGAVPVLADIDPRTFNLSPAAVREVSDRQPTAIRATRFSAILPVHLYGQCADIDSLQTLAGNGSALLIEDAAQAFAAEWNGRRAGSLAHAAAFSFYPTKNLAAAGDAGMVTTVDPDAAERMRSLRAHGMRRRYYHDEIGWNSRLDTLQAAVLLVKLRFLDIWTERRRALATGYDQLFRQAGLVEADAIYPEDRREGSVVLPFTDPRARHVFHQYVIRVRRRDELRAFLTEQRIGSEIYYPLPLHLQQSLRFLGYREGDFPESERAAREVLALPIFPQLRADEQERVVAAISRFFR
ncbi:MAG: DegT/DnrJ/EryC1/StrS family aminotransferase [Acidobacteriaceae bacterium]